MILIILFQLAIAQDTFEDRWNQIYEQYYSQAMTDAEWAQIAGDKINETYKIQSGDTLWDISITLFGNGYYWPKVWQLNSEITNPHLIEPGYELRFIPGTVEVAPALEIAAAPGTSAPTPTTPAQTTVQAAGTEPGLTREPQIPPPKFQSKPVLEKLPPSLPYLTVKISNDYDRDGFSIEETKPTEIKDLYAIKNFIVRSVPEPDGKIVEAEGVRTVASTGQYVYIRAENGSVGKKYYSYSVGEKVVGPYVSSASAIYVEAEMEMTELVNASKNIYKALVHKTVNPVKVGSMVKEGEIEFISLNPTQQFAKVSGQVVGGEYYRERKVLGLDTIIYFNVGSEDGVQVGNMMRILKNEAVRKSSSVIREEETPIAQAKIIHVDENYSTGIILKLVDEVRPGDFAGENVFTKLDTNEVENELKSESLNIKEEQSAKFTEEGIDESEVLDESEDAEMSEDQTLDSDIESEMEEELE